ncbi:GGDEF domain-containing protein [Shewanella algae]|uniref:GGDEF domain-containing protein n=1 Tax=Shewanella algae TaxID=38313 RepID=UPI0012DD3A4E|nr:GGDEF domain-containing protein [Shewanella algae]QGS58818.1 diguanylate cyclase [Shewanella algae]
MDLSQIWTDESEYRRVALKVSAWTIFCLGVLFSGFNWYMGLPLLSLMELTMAGFCLLLLYRLPTTSRLKEWSLCFLSLLFFIVLLGIWQARLSSILYSWLFIFPLLSYLLLGKRWGVGFNAVFIFGGMSLLLLRLVMLESELHFSLFINVGLCLSTLWIMSHVFESKRAEMVERLQLMAALDPLTSVYNRLHLEPVFNLLQQQMTGRLALLLVDVDHFKQINDNLGHDAGDRVLQQLARLLQEFVPSPEHVFRVGGEEFCLLLPVVDMAEAQRLAESVRAAAESLPLDLATAQGLSVSIGIALSPEPSSRPKPELRQVYRQADERLYQAKLNGRNRIEPPQS